MKKTTYSICCLLAFTTFSSQAETTVQSDFSQPMTIESHLLEFVDGTALIDIGEIIAYARRVRVLHHGKKDAETGETRGIIPFGDKFCTLIELRDMEARKESLSQEEQAALEVSRIFVLNRYTEISAPYMETVKGSKEQMVGLIEKWSVMRNRKDSELLNWSKLGEAEELNAFNNNMHSYKTIDQFLTDLTCFLADLVRSCKKSWAHYKEEVRRKAHEQHSA